MDVTPLIDIIFQLVLFFMVSTTFVSAPGIGVDLPRQAGHCLEGYRRPQRMGQQRWVRVVDEEPVFKV